MQGNRLEATQRVHSDPGRVDVTVPALEQCGAARLALPHAPGACGTCESSSIATSSRGQQQAGGLAVSRTLAAWRVVATGTVPVATSTSRRSGRSTGGLGQSQTDSWPGPGIPAKSGRLRPRWSQAAPPPLAVGAAAHASGVPVSVPSTMSNRAFSDASPPPAAGTKSATTRCRRSAGTRLNRKSSVFRGSSLT